MKNYLQAKVGEKFYWSTFTSDFKKDYWEGVRLEKKNKFEKVNENRWKKTEKVSMNIGGSNVEGVMNIAVFHAPDGNLLELPLILDVDIKKQ